ncbi:MAG: TIGR00282 family metallophosphoesterase [Armatimonadota bacterium]
MRLLIVGDVVGRAGRRALRALLPDIVARENIDFVVANCENAASFTGITPRLVEQILSWGVDAITMGNHVWAQKSIYDTAHQESRFIRPANYPPGVPGAGGRVLQARNGAMVATINLCGRIFMEPMECPFRAADAEIERLREQADVIVVDFHAEATSEKAALGRYLDGRVAVVAGTHTHVQTADERILPGGTAYITDCGMTGPLESVIGIAPDLVIRRFLTRMPVRFEAARGIAALCGIIVDADEATDSARSIVRVCEVHEPRP